ncbi:hypothetical protein U1Q18_014353 [Sarracenia purpurea var. burkii]
MQFDHRSNCWRVQAETPSSCLATVGGAKDLTADPCAELQSLMRSSRLSWQASYFFSFSGNLDGGGRLGVLGSLNRYASVERGGGSEAPRLRRRRRRKGGVGATRIPPRMALVGAPQMGRLKPESPSSSSLLCRGGGSSSLDAWRDPDRHSKVTI